MVYEHGRNGKNRKVLEVFYLTKWGNIEITGYPIYTKYTNKYYKNIL